MRNNTTSMIQKTSIAVETGTSRDKTTPIITTAVL